MILSKKLNISILIFLVISLAFGFTGLSQEDLNGTFSVWSVNQQKGPAWEAQKEALEAFAAKHPGVELDLNLAMNGDVLKTKLPNSFATGAAPDMFYVWGGSKTIKFAKNGFLADLTDLVSTPPLDQYISKTDLSAVSYKGKNYAVPLAGWGGVFALNTKIFEEAGIEPPPSLYQPTWDEFISWVKTIRSNTEYAPIVAPADRSAMWVPHFWYISLFDRLTEDEYFFRKTINRVEGYSFTDPPFVEAAERLKELVDLNAFQEGFTGDNYAAAISKYQQGDGAIMYNGSWWPPRLKSEAPEVYENSINIRFPSLQEGVPQDTLLGTIQFFWSVYSNGNTEIAKEFLKFMIHEQPQYSSKIIEASSRIPALKGVDPDPEATGAPKFYETTSEKWANSSYKHRAWNTYSPNEWAQTLLDQLQLLILGETSPEKFTKALEEKAEELENNGTLPLSFWSDPE